MLKKMLKKPLAQLYAEHDGKVSDKWNIYLEEYGRIFDAYRDEPVRLLEIGIQNGGSLEIWSKYFENAQKLVGCDIDPNCALLNYEDPRIAVVIGDANNDATQSSILRHAPTLDIVIDDGSHRSSDIVTCFAKYFPHLSDGGVFIAEDLHCSYWQEFEGGLFDPYSSVAFFKRLIDICNYEHWAIKKNNRSRVLESICVRYGIRIDEETLRQVHSVEFINSMCVVRKSRPECNTLGARVIAGSEATVAPGVLEFDPSSRPVENSQQNAPPGVPLLPEEELLVHEKQLAVREKRIAELKGKVADLEKQVADYSRHVSGLDEEAARLKDMLEAMRNSTSWRITSPVRIVGHQVKRFKRIIKLLPVAIRHGGGLGSTFSKASRVFQREGFAGVKRSLRIVQEGGLGGQGMTGSVDRNSYAEWIRLYDTLTGQTRATMFAAIEAWPDRPLISVIMPTYNSRPEWLIQAIESVRNQNYPYWELCIADDASTRSEVREILDGCAKDDPRIKVVYRECNGHISAASNSALELVNGKWVALLDHDDLLAEHALFWVADAINRNPKARLIYSDEDKIDEVGKRFDPYFKCDWNLGLFYSHNLITHLGVYQTSLLHEIGGFRVGFEGAQDYDLALRYVERISPSEIHHIPRVLYHWRVHAESTALRPDTKPYAMLAGERALNEHLHRQGLNANAELIGFGYRVRYALPETLPLVSLIILTRNGMHLIRQCVESILGKTTYSNYEILIVDNGSDDAGTLRFLEDIQSDSRVRVVRDDRAFNFSALNNAAVPLAAGELIGLLNNDIEVISPDWLTEMVSHALRPDIGAVGARLWYPNDTLQHGGIILGIGGWAGHAHKGYPRGHPGYVGRMALLSDFTAVTGACLVVRKELYERFGGLNEAELQVACNDVDFCLRLREAGYRNIWTPYADLYHHESATRGFEDTPEKQARFAKELAYMKRRWGKQLLYDPAYSPNLTLDREDFSLAWPPRVEPANVPNNEAQFLSRSEKALLMVDRNGLGLEIGPSHNPLAPKKQGFNVHILDHLNTEDLRKKYEGHGVNLDNIEEVDFVWRGEALHELIGCTHCYDWIIASHIIEHVPDVITFLIECERLLKPNGVLSLVIPDKRYCFDYFNALTSTGELLDAFERKRTRPSPGKVFDHFAGAVTRNGAIAWGNADKGNFDLVHNLTEARSFWERATSTTEYIDVHNWRFTPGSFRLILSDIWALGLTRLTQVKEFDTHGCEFFVTLRKASRMDAKNRLLMLDTVRSETCSLLEDLPEEDRRGIT